MRDRLMGYLESLISYKLEIIKAKRKSKSLDCIKDKESFSQCLVVVKEIFAKKAIASNPYKAGHFKLNWKIDEDTISLLNSFTRVSTKLALAETRMRHTGDQIRIFAEQINLLGEEQPPLAEHGEDITTMNAMLISKDHIA
ncbi:unnamed protein product [Arabis nemorensis]|uniref:Uncharacterized protein n=1 Tax=Arabis nemorensis TaxID=586526 RepID=A0A565BGA5_9BRAS|nr:unnamed protein product [Arabis nemorensis]